MRHPLHGALAGVALSLVVGAGPLYASVPLPAPQLRALKAQEPHRTALALARARALAPQLGLKSGESLALKNAFTNPAGRTVVRFDQTYAGHRVFGASTIGHVEADGSVKVLGTGLRAGAVPTGEPKLTPDQAQAIALKLAALKGQPMPLSAELVVFPTSMMTGLRATLDAASRKLVLDRSATVVGRPTKPYVWAYKVNVFTRNREDGLTGMDYFIDAESGGLLRKDSTLRYQAAPGTPAQGIGLPQYRTGYVTLDTTLEEDGTYTLRDTTRGSKPNPFFAQYLGMDLTGLTALYEVHDWENYGALSFYTGNTTNTWGDGYPFADYPTEGQKSGETAAADAHFGMSTTWDMYKNVFGRDGIDGQGTTPIYIVHARDGMGRKLDNAMWTDQIFGMVFGDGTYLPDTLNVNWETGLPYPGNPSGMMSLTELSIVGHELSHGLTSQTADLIYQGESGGLNEASSDIMGTLVEAYSYRRPGEDDKIPNFGNTWMNGGKCRPSGPLRFYDTPSKDGLSADAWYGGIDWMEVHYSSGPMNRCFYYLSAGAPSDSRSEHYSVYLPQGMDGIGNDHAGQIYFKALTEYMTPTTNYQQAGEAMVQAATDIYGEGSAELTATKKALTAINVQVAGEPLLTRVSFPSNTGGVLSSYPGAEFLAQALVLPMGASVPNNAVVTNNADGTAVWKPGGHRAMFAAPGSADPTEVGVVNADGTWTAPLRSGCFILSAASKAKPEQFTEGLAFVQDLDADADGEQDAIDMGATSFSWFLSSCIKPSHSPYGGTWVDDLDVDLFQTAIKNAWGAK